MPSGDKSKVINPKIDPCILLRGFGHRYTAVILGLRWETFFARLQNLRIDLKADLEASSLVNAGIGGRRS